MTRLTQLSHGGGCGCKIAPSVLSEIIKELPLPLPTQALVVGAETSDDAAVYKLNDTQALVLTTDFFMPIVDDAYDFGRIAATNAISDVYAMGGQPLMALAVLGMPVDKLSVEEMRAVMRGGIDVCRDAGIPLAGGHSIDAPEPIFGLVAAGIVHPDRVLKNCNAKPGDAILLLKPLGIGIMTTALKRELLSSQGYKDVLHLMTQLNKVGQRLAEIDDVHAVTDVTGFGLIGHLGEMCKGSKLGANISYSAVPVLAEAVELARTHKCFPGGASRNLKSNENIFEADKSLSEEDVLMLCDPQTSGGLLVAVASESVERVLSLSREMGFGHARKIGEFQQAAGKIRINP